MRKAHKGAPLCLIKKEILKDFTAWCEEREAEESLRNLLEFLIQKRLIEGPTFLDYIDKIPGPLWIREKDVIPEMLREGFIPPQAWIGARKGRNSKD